MRGRLSVKRGFSLKGKVSVKGCLLLITLSACLLQALLIGAGLYLFAEADSGLGFSTIFVIASSTSVSIVLLLFLLNQFYKPVQKLITALETGVASFKDKDFSITIHNERNDELGRIVDTYNDMSTTLREERMSLFQRELLLDTIIQSSPVSIVLCDQRGFVIYANGIAKHLFQQQSKLEGRQFDELLQALPDELRNATEAGKDGLVSLMKDSERVSYYLHCQTFVLNSSEHHLYLYKNLTTELSRQEIDLWKKAIRLISHELNNSLAPVSSLANSAKKILASDQHIDSLPDIIDTIAQRVKKLNAFLKEYAEFARLSAPKLEGIELPDFIDELLKICPFVLKSEVPNVTLQLDIPQLEQVFLNLYKNALESDSDPQKISLSVDLLSDKLIMLISDAGGGMNEQQLQQALLPFYTTKSGGSGLGLSLCNEIVIAHNGLMRLQNNSNPGLDIRIILPL